MEIHAVGPAHSEALARFFEVLNSHGIDNYFHPHPLTAEAARERATYTGMDLYFVLLDGEEIIGYALLRGWEEGYDVPSLGLAIHPKAQGKGLGRLLMEFLRTVALRRGAHKIRLRVHPDNKAAIALYSSLGYELTAENDGPYLVGMLDLNGR